MLTTLDQCGRTAEASLWRRSGASHARQFRWWAGLLGATVLLRLMAMIWVPLAPEEAYYWMYAQNPNLSYFDHPPMVAWVISLGTLLFGDTEFGVRVIGAVLMLGASALIYVFARMWFGRAAALLSAAALQILPVYVGAGFIATMDAPLLFFWTGGLVGISLALRRNRPAGWYLAGFALGAAMLSKYTGVFLGAGAVLAVVGHRPWRRHLMSVHPYLASMAAVAMFSPVIIWNAQHDWASFRFQFLDRFGAHDAGVKHMFEFIEGQLVVATPIVLLAAACIVLRCARNLRRLRVGRNWLVLCLSLPLLAVMLYKSVRYQIHINWTLPAYLSLIPAVIHFMTAAVRASLRGRVNVVDRQTSVAWTLILCVIINAGFFSYLLLLEPRLRLIRAFGPWAELATIVEEYEDIVDQADKQEPLILADGQYRLASVLAFYRTPIEKKDRPARFTSNQWFFGDTGLGYAYWMVREDWVGRDCIYIDYDGNVDDDLRGSFASFELVDDPRLRRLGYQLAICRNYLGPGRNLQKPDGQTARKPNGQA